MVSPTNDLLARAEYEDGKARRCDVLARLARRNKNGALKALWELYAKQARDMAVQLRELATI